MATEAQRNAAFDALKAQVDANVPSFFRSQITDEAIMGMVDVVLAAAEQAAKEP